MGIRRPSSMLVDGRRVGRLQFSLRTLLLFVTLFAVASSIMLTPLCRQTLQYACPLENGTYKIRVSRINGFCDKCRFEEHTQTIEAYSNEPFTLILLRAPIWLEVYSSSGYSNLQECIERTDWEELARFKSRPQNLGYGHAVRIRMSLSDKIVSFQDYDGLEQKVDLSLPSGKIAMASFRTRASDTPLRQAQCIMKYEAGDSIFPNGRLQNKVSFIVIATAKEEKGTDACNGDYGHSGRE